MMQPGQFMLYATPVILLIAQEIRAYLTQRELRQVTAAQTGDINKAGDERARTLQHTTLDTASKLALHTSDQATALATELDTIHEIVNGNTSALLARIASLEDQLAHALLHPAAKP
jgi:hypothetical protein